MLWAILLAALPSQPDSPNSIDHNDRHSALSQMLDAIDRDATALQNDELPTQERARIALQLRQEAERLPPLTDGQPDSVKRRALDVERQCAKLFEAATQRRSISQPATQLSVSVNNLRAVLGP
jgi:hypothetical protein